MTVTESSLIAFVSSHHCDWLVAIAVDGECVSGCVT